MKFIGISYNLPANPSRYRVATWKTLKDLGAVYFQPGVAVLPEKSGREEDLKILKNHIQEWNGTASLVTIEYVDAQDEQEMLETFENARKEEYENIKNESEKLYKELRSAGEDKAMNDDGFQLEIRQLKRRLEKAVAHDYFQSAAKVPAEQIVKELAKYLQKEPKSNKAIKTAVKKPVEPATKEPEVEAPRKREEMPVFLF